MGKDPALLWYPSDWSSGTALFTFEEKGAYMTLLMAQFESYSLSLDDIKHLLGLKFDTIWGRICHKFQQDEDGKYYQHRIREEKEKRVNYTNSRKKNLMKPHMESHMVKHMENRNRNIITNTTNTTNNTNIHGEVENLQTQTGQENPTPEKMQKDLPKTKPLFNPTGTRVFSDWSELETTLIGEITWKESVCRKYKITMDRVETAVKSWIIHVSTQGQEYMALTEAKRWCANWIGSELKQMAKDQPNTPTYYKPHPLSSKK
jgi:uncharacterized protein YdaU (DUF1376 family)